MKNKKFQTALIKRHYPQIRNQDIGKLAQAGRRLKRMANGALHKDWDKLGPRGQVMFHDIINTCLSGAQALKQELERRRVNAPAFRSALPLKKQRLLLATNTSVAAQKLLAGESLAAAT